MKLKSRELNIYIDESILIVACLCVIFNEVREYFSNYFICYLFITFHELSHMFTASLFGIKTKRLNVSVSGLNINLNKRKGRGLKWLCIFLAGPISNIILTILFKNIPIVNTINLALAIINLMPIYPLDGYNIFEILLQLIGLQEKNIVKIQRLIKIIVIILFIIIGIYQCLIFKNISVILMSIYIFIQGYNPRKKQFL